MILKTLEVGPFASNCYVVASELTREAMIIDPGDEADTILKKVEELGAGEILLTSVDRDGTGLGYDFDLVKTVAQSVSIPVIASGGPGKLKDLEKIIVEGHADAVAIASMLHYDAIDRAKLDLDSFTEGNLEFLKSGHAFTKFETTSISKIKKYLIDEGVQCRLHNKRDAYARSM